MEAGDRKQLTCTSMQPLSAQRALNDIVFSCPEFDVQATLIEMRDAGWRLISVDIGSETSHDGVVEMPAHHSDHQAFLTQQSLQRCAADLFRRRFSFLLPLFRFQVPRMDVPRPQGLFWRTNFLCPLLLPNACKLCATKFNSLAKRLARYIR